MRAAEVITIVGAGLMGHGIAQVFACAGHSVVVTDTSPEALETVHSRVRANLTALGLDPAPAERIVTCGDLATALAGADIAIEAVREDLSVKRELFRRMSRLVRDDTILASNTSVIAISQIASLAHRPERVVGTHWWNPPYLVPLVEVTKAASPRPVAVEQTMDLLRRAGKSPVWVRKDIPGFVGNRLQHALWREAFALVAAGVCDAESIDRVVKDGFGRRLAVLGPCENADLVGLDLTLAIHDYVFPHLDRSTEPAALLRELVAEGALGMRSGRGLRTWTETEAQAVRTRLMRHLNAPVRDGGAPAPPLKGDER